MSTSAQAEDGLDRRERHVGQGEDEQGEDLDAELCERPGVEEALVADDVERTFQRTRDPLSGQLHGLAGGGRPGQCINNRNSSPADQLGDAAARRR